MIPQESMTVPDPDLSDPRIHAGTPAREAAARTLSTSSALTVADALTLRRQRGLDRGTLARCPVTRWSMWNSTDYAC